MKKQQEVEVNLEEVLYSPLLRKILQTNQGRPVPLREVIASALYDPQEGYYTKNIRSIGARGDFTTLPMKTKILATAIVEWLRRNSRLESCPLVCDFVELGAGDGTLMKQIKKKLRIWELWRWRFKIVDISQPLMDLQKKQLGNSVKYYSDLESAVRNTKGCAFILGNEFVDAFPPTVLQFYRGGWREVQLECNSGGAAKISLSKEEHPTIGQHFPTALEGQRIELPESFCKWLRKIRPWLKKALILLIDYGGATQEVYKNRKNGTLRSYSFHQREHGINALSRLGKCDITYDVDFSYVMREATSFGYEMVQLRSLFDFFSEYSPDSDLYKNNHLLQIIGSYYCLELRVC